MFNYFTPLKKIVLTGPESTGKTTLAAKLATHFQSRWVPEYARAYIDQLERDYQQSDLLEIAKGQIRQEQLFATPNLPYLFCDSDLITIKIWSDYKYQSTHPWIEQQIQKRSYDLYLLCAPDIPWQPDPQRENPNGRDALFKTYKDTLLALHKNFVEINGSSTQRWQQALNAIQKLG